MFKKRNNPETKLEDKKHTTQLKTTNLKLQKVDNNYYFCKDNDNDNVLFSSY